MQISAERLARVKNQYGCPLNIERGRMFTARQFMDGGDSGFYMQTDEKWEWWAEQLAHHARNVHALQS